jgi:hypothetical protein
LLTFRKKTNSIYIKQNFVPKNHFEWKTFSAKYSAGIFPKFIIIGKDSGTEMYSCLHLEIRQNLHKAENKFVPKNFLIVRHFQQITDEYELCTSSIRMKLAIYFMTRETFM